MVLGFAGAVYPIWLYLTWLPGFLRIQHHMTTVQIGFAASVPFIFGFLGSLAGGAFSDRLAARGISPINSRKLPIAAGLIGMATFTVLAALTDKGNVAVACIALAMFCGSSATTNAWALVTATAPSSYVASLGSIQNFGGYFGGSFAPVITGFVVDKTGSFTLPLLVAAAVPVAAALVYFFVVREPISAAFLERSDAHTHMSTLSAPPQTPPGPVRRLCRGPSRASGKLRHAGAAGVILLVHGIHGRVVFHVAQVDKPADDVVEFQTSIVEYQDVVLRHLMDLVADGGRSCAARGAGPSPET